MWGQVGGRGDSQSSLRRTVSAIAVDTDSLQQLGEGRRSVVGRRASASTGRVQSIHLKLGRAHTLANPSDGDGSRAAP